MEKNKHSHIGQRYVIQLVITKIFSKRSYEMVTRDDQKPMLFFFESDCIPS